MKCIFISLGKLESLGVRLKKVVLGNILFPRAIALVCAEKHNSKFECEFKNNDNLPISIIK